MIVLSLSYTVTADSYVGVLEAGIPPLRFLLQMSRFEYVCKTVLDETRSQLAFF